MTWPDTEVYDAFRIYFDLNRPKLRRTKRGVEFHEGYICDLIIKKHAACYMLNRKKITMKYRNMMWFIERSPILKMIQSVLQHSQRSIYTITVALYIYSILIIDTYVPSQPIRTKGEDERAEHNKAANRIVC